MEMKKSFFNQKFTCKECGKVYKEPVNFCSDCGACLSEAGENLQLIRKHNIQLETIINIIGKIDDPKTLAYLKNLASKLKD